MMTNMNPSDFRQAGTTYGKPVSLVSLELIATQGGEPALPPNIDVIGLRTITNAAKLSAHKAHGPHPDVSEHDIEIPIRDGSTIPTRVYYPAEKVDTKVSLPLLIFFHGGGFCIGSRYDDFQSNRAIALRNSVVVVSPEYRLAPEHPFPTAVHDGLDPLQWVAANAHTIHSSASPSAGLIVGGTSSGGNIASAVVYLNRDQDFPVNVTGQFLSVAPLLPAPVVPEEYRQEHLSVEQNKEISIPSSDLVQLFLSAYKPNIHSPLMVPFNHPERHHDIPSTYFQVCGLDALRDDSLIYERVLREENSIATRLDFYPGLPHHFWEFYPQLTQHAQRRTEDTVNGIQWLLELGR
ncbi:uncharacterized protein N7496_000352 [Penicillium cataractarum]|uniref:Alpha/beta hydrolase fold-3 domain-containing protein n=1 Tax=Penicillium cataractarum TaxID=2100454 RepID=A0A9X0B5U7_9EURO|nr:uncharacterized protein N7496_000352 [Penicillium cataractarum]KAJ5389284.1 hypothetical protein N7496_000352 [Penicillium cataractarum]